MNFRNPQEPEQLPDRNHTRNRLLQAIHTVRHLKLWRVLLGLIIATIVFFIISVWLKGTDPGQLTWLRIIPWDSLATTALGVAFIGYVFEWVVRNETKQELDEALKTNFEKQEQELNRQIPKAILTTRAIMQDMLDREIVDAVILTGLEARLDDIQLAREAYDSFLSHLLNHEERRSNYRCSVYLANIQGQDIPAVVAQKYYDGYIEVRYITTLQKDTFKFICVPTMEEYEDLLKDPSWELRWVAEPTKDYPPEVAFQVEAVHVHGHNLQLQTESTNRRIVIYANHPELQSLQGKQVTVYYRYRVKIKKRGHLLMVHVSCPTHNVAVDLYYAHTDIHFVNVLDFFTSKTKPNIRYLPTRKKCEKIEVEVNDWVFPKGGVVFVWVLQAENNPDFWKPSSAQRRSGRFSSKPNSRITDILPPILLEPDKEDDPTGPPS